MTVCYFTATGNCLYMARRIGGTLLSIPQLMWQEAFTIEDDAVGVVCPVYNAEMPMMVRACLLLFWIIAKRKNAGDRRGMGS